jgi:hypothetical protein
MKSDFFEQTSQFEQMKSDFSELKCNNEKLESRNVKLANQLSELVRMKSKFDQVESEIQTLRENSDKANRLEFELSKANSENSKLRKEFEEIKVKFDKTKLDHSVSQKRAADELFNLKNSLEESLSINEEVKRQATLRNDNLSKENNNLKEIVNSLETQLYEEQKKRQATLAELEGSKKINIYLHDLSKSKNLTISKMKLNEERDRQIIAKLGNCPKNVNELKSNSDNFISIKSALEKMFKEDQEFCRTMAVDDQFDVLDDSEICEMARFMLSDYLETKRLHLSDITRGQTQLAAMHKDYFDKLNSVVAKLKTKCDVINKLNFEFNKCRSENKSLSKNVEALKFLKNRELMLLTKVNRLEESLKMEFKTKEALRKEITKLQSSGNLSVRRSGRVNDDQELLKAELNRQIKENQTSAKQYMDNLTQMKNQVKKK